MVELEDDLDSFFEDDSVLSAVAAAENQHMKQRCSIYGTGGQEYASKRKEQWGERANSYSHQAHQSSFQETESSEDKRRRTVDDREYNGPANFQEQLSGTTFDSQPEGEYMAALRGSNSELWLKVSREKGSGGNLSRGSGSSYAGNAAEAAGGRGGASGTCYKCGLEGHWARDCPMPTVAGSFPFQSGGQLPEPSDVPEKSCPCGAGLCVVLTASTEKNLGRRFYKCPVKRDEGQCTFFEWCDGGGGGQSFPTDRASTISVPQIDCKCGAGPCVTLTAKTERNNGRAFYKCPLPKEQGCGFFQWCDEVGKDSSRPSTVVSSKSFSSSDNAATGTCYKCGLGGHWAKDCTAPQNTGSFGNSSSAYTPGTKKDFGNLGSRQSPVGGSCFRCGQGGHWSRDCPKEGAGGGSALGQAYSSGRSPEVKNTQPCFNCGRPGHWSSSCPNSGGGVASGGSKQLSSGGPLPGGSCYKCGNSGHWANRCPVASGGYR